MSKDLCKKCRQNNFQGNDFFVVFTEKGHTFDEQIDNNYYEYIWQSAA